MTHRTPKQTVDVFEGDTALLSAHVVKLDMLDFYKITQTQQQKGTHCRLGGNKNCSHIHISVIMKLKEVYFCYMTITFSVDFFFITKTMLKIIFLV